MGKLCRILIPACLEMSAQPPQDVLVGCADTHHHAMVLYLTAELVSSPKGSSLSWLVRGFTSIFSSSLILAWLSAPFRSFPFSSGAMLNGGVLESRCRRGTNTLVGHALAPETSQLSGWSSRKSRSTQPLGKDERKEEKRQAVVKTV